MIMETKNKVVYCISKDKPAFRENEFPFLVDSTEAYSTLFFFEDEQCNKFKSPKDGECLSVTYVRKQRDGIVWKIVYRPHKKLSEYLEEQDIHPLRIVILNDYPDVDLYFSAVDELEVSILTNIFGRIVIYPHHGLDDENPDFDCLRVHCMPQNKMYFDLTNN